VPASITPASATEGSDVVFNFTLSNPSAVDTSYTFVIDKWYGWSADYTTTDVTVVPAGATWNGIGTNNCGYN
jgi:hypothetical protein